MSTSIDSSCPPAAFVEAPEPTERLYVNSSAKLAEFVSSLSSENDVPCAVDTEADSLHCYEEKLCLIQMWAEGRAAIIDPLEIDDFGPLLDFLDRSVVWMHGADFDMRMLRATFDRIPPKVYDTQIAARLLGQRRFGLANIVEDYCGVTLSKQSQKADWGKRPLPEKMISYAVNDVRYLLPMAEHFQTRLRDLDRWDWFLQSCEAARKNASQREQRDPEEVWKISGWGKLKPPGLAHLRGLWRWRDDEARRRDRPPFKIVSNEKLLGFATALAAGERVSVPPKLGKLTIARFEEAISEVKALSKADWPTLPKRKRTRRDPNFDQKFSAIRDVRDKAADKLDIEPSLVASRSVLEKLAVDPELSSELLLPWQEALLKS
ncbi:MAG: HRDC domain-containing protein [Verrucomicrobiota bacterium]